MPGRTLMFGEYLFYSGAVSWDALIGAIVWQRRQRPRFGEIARRWGWITERDILAGFGERKHGEQLGQSLVRLGILSEIQLNMLIRRQRGLQSPIGEYFVANGHFSPMSLDRLLQGYREHNSIYN